MADRILNVRLSAQVADYKRALEEASKKTRELGSETEKLQQRREAFNQIGAAGVAMGGLLSAGLGVAIKRFADFDQAMSGVDAATHATASNMELLRQAALDAGASTVFSATEAANAIEELAKAGVSTTDVLDGGLTGALNLAAAGNLGVADAAGIAATALQVFGLQGDDMSHVADLLAAGAGKAMGDVTDLSQALNQAGLVANQTGLSIEETTAGLAAFAEQGLLGSDAGTSFKSMLQRLSPQSAEAERMMTELGISAYDASGKFVGLASFAGNLQGALKDLTPEQRNAAMATIFGSDAVRAAGVIYAQGEDGIRDWISAVDDQGYAADTARRRLDNLKGDLEALGGAMETALITTGSGANDSLRTMAQALTGLVDIYNGIPQPAQDAMTAVGGATAAVTLAGGAAFLAVPKFLDFKETIESAGWSLSRLSLTSAGAGLALGGLFLIVGQLAAQHQRAQQRAQEYADTLEDGTRQITDATRDLIAENMTATESFAWLETTSLAESAEHLGISLDTVRKAIEGDADALKEVNEVTQKSIDAWSFWDNKAIVSSSAAHALRDGIEEQVGSLDRAEELARRQAEATREGTDAADGATDAYLDQASSVDDLSTQLSSLIETINRANGVGQDAITANARYQSALAGLAREVERSGTSLDRATEAGSANAAALADLAGLAQNAAAAQLEQDKATMSSKDAADKYYETLVAQRQAFVDSAVAAGYNADEVTALADEVFKLPTAREVQVIAQTDTAEDKLRRLKESLASIPAYKRITLESFSVGNFDVSIPGRATGGPIYGPGTGTSDEAGLYALSNGEHVLTAREVRAAGGHSQIEQWRAGLLSGEHHLTADSIAFVVELPAIRHGRPKEVGY